MGCLQPWQENGALHSTKTSGRCCQMSRVLQLAFLPMAAYGARNVSWERSQGTGSDTMSAFTTQENLRQEPAFLCFCVNVRESDSVNGAGQKSALPGSDQGLGLGGGTKGRAVVCPCPRAHLLFDGSMDLPSTGSLGWALRVPCVCMCALGARTCVPSSQLCLKSNSNMDSHLAWPCHGCIAHHGHCRLQCPDGKGKGGPHMLRAWAGPQQSVGVKI